MIKTKLFSTLSVVNELVENILRDIANVVYKPQPLPTNRGYKLQNGNYVCACCIFCTFRGGGISRKHLDCSIKKIQSDSHLL